MKIKTVKEKVCKLAKEHKTAIICGGCGFLLLFTGESLWLYARRE